LPRLPHRLSTPERNAAPTQRMNEQIRLTPVRLVGADGAALGVVPTSQALDMAREAGPDLVEVAAQERPPVCKIIGYGRFRYQQSHKQKKAKTHHRRLKEIRVRPKTGAHDFETKVNQARRFLVNKDRVQVQVLFRGRELQHLDEGRRVLQDVLARLADVAKVERPPLMDGKRLVATLVPK
jgi:translation initiation factor IF-3